MATVLKIGFSHRTPRKGQEGSCTDMRPQYEVIELREHQLPPPVGGFRVVIFLWTAPETDRQTTVVLSMKGQARMVEACTTTVGPKLAYASWEQNVRNVRNNESVMNGRVLQRVVIPTHFPCSMNIG